MAIVLSLTHLFISGLTSRQKPDLKITVNARKAPLPKANDRGGKEEEEINNYLFQMGGYFISRPEAWLLEGSGHYLSCTLDCALLDRKLHLGLGLGLDCRSPFWNPNIHCKIMKIGQNMYKLRNMITI